MGRFAGRTGIDEDFYAVDKRADLMVSAPIEEVSPAVVENGQLAGKFDALRLEVGAAGRSIGEEWPLVWTFQLRGQTWTQVSGLAPYWPNLEMAKELSETLATRCFCIAATDDVYNSHALFDGGEVEELALYCTQSDLERILPRLGLDFSPDDEAEDWDEADYFHSRLREAGVCLDDFLARETGFFLHYGEIGDRTDYGVIDADLSDLVRMDLIFSD